MSDTFEVFITKYALTEAGILSGRARLVAGAAGDPARVVVEGKMTLEGDEWHRTLDGARAHLAKMAAVRVALLSKQLKESRRILAHAKKAMPRPV